MVSLSFFSFLAQLLSFERRLGDIFKWVETHKAKYYALLIAHYEEHLFLVVGIS